MPKSDATADNVNAAVREILLEQLPKVVGAVHRAHEKGSLTIKIDLAPHKELADRVNLAVTPKLSLPGVGAVWGGRIEKIAGEAQLSLLTALEGVA